MTSYCLVQFCLIVLYLLLFVRLRLPIKSPAASNFTMTVYDLFLTIPNLALVNKREVSEMVFTCWSFPGLHGAIFLQVPLRFLSKCKAYTRLWALICSGWHKGAPCGPLWKHNLHNREGQSNCMNSRMKYALLVVVWGEIRGGMKLRLANLLMTERAGRTEAG